MSAPLSARICKITAQKYLVLDSVICNRPFKCCSSFSSNTYPHHFTSQTKSFGREHGVCIPSALGASLLDSVCRSSRRHFSIFVTRSSRFSNNNGLSERIKTGNILDYNNFVFDKQCSRTFSKLRVLSRNISVSNGERNNQHKSYRCFHRQIPEACQDGSKHKSTVQPEDKENKSNKNTQRNSNKSEDLNENIATIPNILTASRMALSPVLGGMVLYEHFHMACALFVFAGATDLLDGWIARNFKNQASFLGSAMDPLADKLLVTIMYITLTMVNLIPLPLTLLIVGRDISLVGVAFYLRFISLPPPRTLKRYFDITNATAELKPLFISKVNTAFQLSLACFTLAAPVFDYVGHPCLQALWYITASTTVMSAVGYAFVKDTYAILDHAKKNLKS